MALLYRHLRIYQVFGANTDVGKTIFSTLLCRATAQRPNESRAAVGAVYYLKPVSTGPEDEADDSHVIRFSKEDHGLVSTTTLFQYDDPVSPHLAVKMKGISPSDIPDDGRFTALLGQTIQKLVQSSPRNQKSCAYIETAGGVHSPMPSGSSQADAYRALRLPTILVGDSRLGGISSTISAYESLLLRGFDVVSLLIFRDEYYRNWEYLSAWFASRAMGSRIKVSAVPAPPARHPEPKVDQETLAQYYERTSRHDSLMEALEHLDASHERRVQELGSMPQRTLDHVWWPFVQHGMIKGKEDVTVIDSAQSDFFTTNNGSVSSQSPTPSSSLLRTLYDGSASWWTQSVGHANPSLTLAAAYAAGRYGHVMFPLATHEPALELAERLITTGPGKGWASRAFFSDNGSTGMEVAIKMAIRASSLRFKSDRTKELGVIGLKGSYHGDTIGTMDACEPGAYNTAVEWYRGRGYWFDPPTVSFRDGELIVRYATTHDSKAITHTTRFASLAEVYDVEGRLLSELASTYKEVIESTLRQLVNEGHAFGALVIEPLVMGAAGMVFVDPLFHRVLIDVVRSNEALFAEAAGPTPAEASAPEPSWKGLPVIFDEVFAGLYRLGVMSGSSILKVNPDISVLAKILTGGLLPLSVTLAAPSIFNAFLSDKKADALLHGHSYTAHPIGCAVANESLKLIEGLKESGAWNSAQTKWESGSKDVKSDAWSFWDPGFVKTLSKLESVEEVMTLGTVLAFKLGDSDGGYGSTLAETMLAPLKEGDNNTFGIHFRALGDVAYFMASLNTPDHRFRKIEERLVEVCR